MPFPLDGIRTCTSGIRAHRASDYTTRVRPPRVSRNKHFSHSPVSSTAKQSCMKTLQLLSAGPRRQASARTSAESDEACQRKTIDRADGMREKKCLFPSTGFEPVPLGYAPTVLLMCVCVCVCVCVTVCVRVCLQVRGCILVLLNLIEYSF